MFLLYLTRIEGPEGFHEELRVLQTRLPDFFFCGLNLRFHVFVACGLCIEALCKRWQKQLRELTKPFCFEVYPCPLFSVRFRKPLFGETGHTIMNLLAVSPVFVHH